MKMITTHNDKEIVYDENIWSGKKEITINGETLEKAGKKTYVLGRTSYNIKGSYLTGVELTNDTESYVLVRKLTVLEYILCFLPLIMVFFGGAIGGALGAVAGISNSVVVRKIDNILLKILVSLGIAVLAFIAWFVIATTIFTAIG